MKKLLVIFFLITAVTFGQTFTLTATEQVAFEQVRENKYGFEDSLQVLVNVQLESLNNTDSTCTVDIVWGSYKNLESLQLGKEASEYYVEEVTFPKQYLIALIGQFYQMAGQQ